MPDRSLAPQQAIAEPVKARRKVRMFSGNTSSSDEAAGIEPPGDAHASGHQRSTSFPGSTSFPAPSSSGVQRIPSISTGAPKLNRSATYGRGMTSPPSARGTASVPAARHGAPGAWKGKVRDASGGSSSGSKPAARSTSLRQRRLLGMGRDVTDMDAPYGRGFDDWGSDDDDDLDLDTTHERLARAAAAQAVAARRIAGPGGAPGDIMMPGADPGAPAVTVAPPVPVDELAALRLSGNECHPLILATPPSDTAGPESAEGKERLEWQSMLASVLGGDILRGESSRIGVELRSKATYKQAIGESLWWQIRARLRNRTEEEERRRVEQRRTRIVDAVLEEIEHFTVKTDIDVKPLDQVAYILEKLSIIESLYPHRGAMRADKPLYDSEAFQSRVDALSAWYSVVRQLQAQLAILQKWTGTEDLDITRPNTNKEQPLVGKNRFHPLDAKALAHARREQADDSTFVDRVLKEDSLRRTFDKRIFLDQIAIIQNAKQTVIAHSPQLAELKLPDFQYELLRIISFPGRLIVEALKTRLRAAEHLVDPDIMVIDKMAQSFRPSVSLAIVIRKQYEEIVAPDPDNRWCIPDSFPEEYRDAILKCIKMFFKLLHWKLKSGVKGQNFGDTDVLEAEWDFLYDAAEAVEGVDLVVAESLCSLTNKLMVRFINYFETSLHVPVLVNAHKASDKVTTSNGKTHDRQPMTIDQMMLWYAKILDTIKMRYRKLQRFARHLTQRFDNSCEYILEDDDTDILVEQLHESGHFLVYTNVYEEQGTYIFADGSLWNRTADVHQLLLRAFAVNLSGGLGGRDVPTSDMGSSDGREEDDTDTAQYLLLISPRKSFAWTGAVMTLNVDKGVDFALEDSRIRLVADGPMTRLGYCKLMFTRSFVEPGTQVVAYTPQLLVEEQAHLPKVNRELKKIARSAHRLSESIIESAAHVCRTLRGSPGTQDLIENWYLFASDHGQRVAPHMNIQAWARFSRLLMRLAISWVSFICDNCDPTDRKTFRWTVAALDYAMTMTRGNNILHLNKHEFALLRAKVANCMTLLISHFDILGARSSIEAKKVAERLETDRRMARLEGKDSEQDKDLLPRMPSPGAGSKMHSAVDRSLRIGAEQRMELITALEEDLAGQSTEQHLRGRVLDEEVSEDRALVFLAASASNISLRWQQGGYIGGGANGSVYVGFNLDSGGIMAVKEIRVQDITNSPALYKQIKDEADVMQMLSHPNIVDYYGIEVHRDRVYIFEEYCPGGSLANLLEHGRIEDEDVIMVYAWQMLEGLQYLHSEGVEHRDVKPDNILLGANSALKFVDFGAAKVIIKGNRTLAKTRAIKGGGPDAGPAVMNSLAGTPMYLAPEVIKGGQGRLGAVDIWSLGCVVLEITTGRKPWSNLDNEWAIMFHIGIATQHPPLPDPGQMSDLGIDFIEQCLTLDPNQRPTASELLHHPWLAPMMEHTLANYSPTTSSIPSSLPSALSTASDLPQGDEMSLSSTPVSATTPPAPKALSPAALTAAVTPPAAVSSLPAVSASMTAAASMDLTDPATSPSPAASTPTSETPTTVPTGCPPPSSLDEDQAPVVTFHPPPSTASG